ncbi:MAG: hypothetical protein CML16_13555 [Pusillimonas sp.]|mgnify:FL=1|nr:hypothetical protein [Pusillimonas sp.]MBC41227.1 hypothetical protein [Pusillimonas sp.]HCP76180.1 hypothetical protein [Pusillimonas sp.]|tara:strand:+ start:46567 stop:47409 length:843 start_codon:yes stop_codon:yes gene_type:complete
MKLPAKAGLGLKPEHFRDLLASRSDVGFLEIHAENYMVEGGPYHAWLERLCAQFSLSVHGVGLSIGGETAPDMNHLTRLKKLLDRYEPALFSEHLAWSGHNGVFLNDLLPLPYTSETLNRVCRHIDQVQTFLGRQMLIENPSTYVQFADAGFSEPEFIRQVVQRTGCGLLLDVNNVYVTCQNHNHCCDEYLATLPLHEVQEIHLAGFSEESDGNGAPLLIDSHDTEVAQAVWNLYAHALTLTGPQPTLLERDGNIPPLSVLCSEAAHANRLLQESIGIRP